MEDVWDEITHVIRGEDHISNTPKQINIIRAIGAEPPAYAHVSHVLGADGKSLSKRHGSVTVDEFRHAGYYAPALMNFLALLGWSYDDKTTIMSRDELVERFSLDRVVPSPATFDYEKLDWMNGMYLRALSSRTSTRTSSSSTCASEGYDWDEELIRRAAPIVQEKIERFGQLPGLRRLPLPRRRAGPLALLDGRRAGRRRGSSGARGRRAVRGGGDRDSSRGSRRGARALAPQGVRADPHRRHRVEDLTGALREHRVAR